MYQITRMWLGFAGIGIGLVHMALAAGSPLPEGILFTLLGATEFGWGVVTFARDRLVVPRIARAVAIAPIMIWALLVVLATLFSAPQLSASLTFLPMAIATIFEIFVAAVLSRHLRPGTAPDAASAAVPAAPPAGRYLLALGVGALALGFLVTPALAATEAGRYAQEHGMHMGDMSPTSESDPLSGLTVPEHEGH